MTDPLVARLRAAGCVFAEDEAALLRDAASGDALEALTARRVAGEPLETVVGWAAFAGLRVPVERGVFVPRRRTELLARTAAELARDGDVVVDLCCGSGAVALAVLAARPALEVHAADVDPVAVACARRSLPADRVHLGDLLDALPAGVRGRLGVVAANAPYVPTDAVAGMPTEARDHEPRHTLDGGADGLDVHRRIVAAAPAWLAPGGVVLVETARRQAPTAVAVMAAAGLTAEVRTDDELEATVVLGRRPGP